MIANIYEKRIIGRMEQMSNCNNIIGRQQGVSHRKCSSLHVARLNRAYMFNCTVSIEDEKHFLMICPVYNIDRSNLIKE